jgi:hypothetical protein
LEANQWTLIGSLHVPREGTGCAVLGDTLYAVGGFDGKVKFSLKKDKQSRNSEISQID